MCSEHPRWDASLRLRLFGSFPSLNCNRVTWKWNHPKSSAASLRVQLWPRLHRFVYIWDTTSRRILYKLPGHAGSVNEVAFHPEEPIGETKQLVHNISKKKTFTAMLVGKMSKCDEMMWFPGSVCLTWAHLCLQCCLAPATSGSTWERSSRVWNMCVWTRPSVCWRVALPASRVNGCGRSVTSLCNLTCTACETTTSGCVFLNSVISLPRTCFCFC